jgi:hypothetical protein
LWNYRLKIRKWSTATEWTSEGSNTAYGCERLNWEGYDPKQTYHSCFAPDLKYNIKWDSNGVGAEMGDDTWEVTVMNSAGHAVSAPVRINTSAATPKWYYLIFTMK